MSMGKIDKMLADLVSVGKKKGLPTPCSIKLDKKTYYMFTNGIIILLDTDPHECLYCKNEKIPAGDKKISKVISIMNEADEKAFYIMPEKSKAHDILMIHAPGSKTAKADITLVKQAITFTGSNDVFYNLDHALEYDDGVYRGVDKFVSKDKSRIAFVLPIAKPKEEEE